MYYLKAYCSKSLQSYYLEMRRESGVWKVTNFLDVDIESNIEEEKTEKRFQTSTSLLPCRLCKTREIASCDCIKCDIDTSTEKDKYQYSLDCLYCKNLLIFKDSITNIYAKHNRNITLNKYIGEDESEKLNTEAVLSKLDELIENKLYYSAYEIIKESENVILDFYLTDLPEKYNVTEKIDVVNEYFNEINNSELASEDVIITLIKKIYNLCRDFPQMDELLNEFELLSASDLIISDKTKEGFPVLQWNPSPSYDVYYSIYRSNIKIPDDINCPKDITNDSELIKNTSDNLFVDISAKPFVDYYYAVFTERMGTHTVPIKTMNPFMYLSEIEVFPLIPGDSQITIRWNKPNHPEAFIEITRIFDNSKMVIDASEGNWCDKDLINGTEYAYSFNYLYIVNGIERIIKGREERALPTLPPPIPIKIKFEAKIQRFPYILLGKTKFSFIFKAIDEKHNLFDLPDINLSILNGKVPTDDNSGRNILISARKVDIQEKAVLYINDVGRKARFNLFFANKDDYNKYNLIPDSKVKFSIGRK